MKELVYLVALILAATALPRPQNTNVFNIDCGGGNSGNAGGGGGGGCSNILKGFLSLGGGSTSSNPSSSFNPSSSSSQISYRTCTNPSPANQGADCRGDRNRQRSCNSPCTIVLSSDGPAAEYNGDTLGVYDLLPGHFRGCPVYRQRHTVGGDVYYLYREADKDWKSGDELGGNIGHLLNQARLDNCALPSTGWQYAGNGPWQPTSLTISTALPSICSSVIITGNSKVTKLWPTSLGTFTLTSDWSAGRPVYKHQTSGRVLLVKFGIVQWTVQTTVESSVASITSGSVPSLNPADRRAAVSARFGRTNWVYWDGEWKQDGGITVKCIN